MQLYISKDGGIEGPHSVEVVQTMLREGRLTPSDLGAIPGDSDWKPLSQLMDVSGAAGVAVPPPMVEQQRAMPVSDVQFTIDGQIPAGTRGKTVRQIAEEVQAGGRFVIYQYVVSIVIMSFRRSSPITYIPPGKSGVGGALGWSMLSMLVGWWGIPWGFIFTIGALWRNAMGGVDVTEPILASWIGPEGADRLVRQRPKRPQGGLWVVRAVILSPFALIVLAVILAGQGAEAERREEAKHPGYGDFKRADEYVQREGVEGGGNTTTASMAAARAQEFLQSLLDESTTGNSGRGERITVWCEMRGETCLFIVRVPDLRRYSRDAKKEIGSAAWLCAQVAGSYLGLSEDTELAVAVRGATLYDRLIVGRFLEEVSDDDGEVELEAAIKRRFTGSSVRKRLFKYFAAGA